MMNREHGLRARGFRRGEAFAPVAKPQSFSTRLRKYLALIVVGILTILTGAITATASAFVRDRLSPVVAFADRWFCKGTALFEPTISSIDFQVVLARLDNDPGDALRDRLKLAIHENTRMPVSSTCHRIELRTQDGRWSLSHANAEAEKVLTEVGGDLLVSGYVSEPGVAMITLTGRNTSFRAQASTPKLEEFLRDMVLAQAIREALAQPYKREFYYGIANKAEKLARLQRTLRYNRAWQSNLKGQDAELARAISQLMSEMWAHSKQPQDLSAAIYHQKSVFEILEIDPSMPNASSAIALDKMRLAILLEMAGGKAGSD